MVTEVPEVVGDATAVVVMITATLGLGTMILGLLWKVFKVHDQIEDMAKELRPNHGGSLRDQIDATRVMSDSNGQALADLRTDTEAAIAQITTTTDAICHANSEAHQAIHRRIDGVFELLAGRGSSMPRKLAEQHATQRAASRDEEG
jgi:hypothetical protein